MSPEPFGRPLEPIRQYWRHPDRIPREDRGTGRRTVNPVISCKRDVVLDDPPGPLSVMRYDGCHPGTEIRMIRIDGLGHAWTRESVDTTAVMWEFFIRHRLAR
jgi:poly(3-hydroxybutyrate) depolymerase